MAKVLVLGEIMLRLSVGGGVRLSDADHLAANYGGAEANVGISLAHYGHDVSFASKVPANPLGDGAVGHLRRMGVDCTHVLRGGPRLGTYYVEEGVGARASQVTYDRAGSSFSLMEGVEWDLDALLEHVDLIHVSGVCPALSEPWRDITRDILRAAHERGVLVSYDVNLRSKLWSRSQCEDFVRTVLPYVDILCAGIGDTLGALGDGFAEWTAEGLEAAYARLLQARPNIRAVYSTNRVAHSSSSNDLTGYLMTREDGLVRSSTRHIEPIVDRVGGGDAFSGGVLHGILSGWDAQRTIDFGCAASVLKHTVAGDCNRFSASEVETFMNSGADVAR